MQETRVQSLGREDPLEKEVATPSSILVWEIPQRGAWWATVHAGSQRVGHTEPARTHALVLPDVCVLGPSHHFTSTVLITITRKNLDIPLCVQY